MSRYWLSFAGETGFLGVMIAEGHDLASAVNEVNRRKLNPGGQVAGAEMPDDEMVELPLYQVLSKDYLMNRGDVVRHGDMPPEQRAIVESKVDRVCQACNEGRCRIH